MELAKAGPIGAIFPTKSAHPTIGASSWSVRCFYFKGKSTFPVTAVEPLPPDPVPVAFYRRFAVVVMPDKGSPVAVEQGQGEGRVPKKSVHRVEVGVRECSIHSVVVYQDRAEVKRVVPARLAPGDNQVVVTGLASCINKDSVRSAVNRVSGDRVVAGPQTTIRLMHIGGKSFL